MLFEVSMRVNTGETPLPNTVVLPTPVVIGPDASDESAIDYKAALSLSSLYINPTHEAPRARNN
jgi:hypothetical protein